MDDLISRQAAIDTEGLEEEIRCEMCRNQMKTDRGCDGNCQDGKLYEKIMQILNERIKPLPSPQPETDCVLKEFGNCSYSETGCSDCKVKAKIRNALSVQPETYGDAVNRADVFDMLEMYPFTEYGEYETAREIVKRLPSAQPEEASVILGTSKDGVRLWYKCSVCGEPCVADDNYCSYCGRRFVNHE